MTKRERQQNAVTRIARFIADTLTVEERAGLAFVLVVNDGETTAVASMPRQDPRDLVRLFDSSANAIEAGVPHTDVDLRPN